MTEPTNTNSSFVPLSLTDTLSKPVRTLHSHDHTRPSSSSNHSSSSTSTTSGSSSNTMGRRSSHLPPPSSSSGSNGGVGSMGGAERVRELERKRVKELMCERLGFGCSGFGGEGEKENGLNELHLEGSELGKEKEKDERDKEVKSLRKQVVRLNEENKRLNARVKGLQEEVVAAKASASASARQGTNGTTSTASALEGVGAIQLKELEKSFADSFHRQESLLAGYQRDAEKSFLTIEAMKKQARRYTDILAKTYGPNYETELGLDQENASSFLTTTKVLSATTGLSSPAMRNQRDRVRNRMSFGGAAAVVTPIASRVEGIEHGIVEEDNEGEGTDRGPSSADASASAKEEGAVEQARYEMLRGYVEGVQTLLRSMEQRLLKRDYELEMMEQRAREEKQLAEAKVDHVEKLISGIRV
ncbi:BZ3500_MvSof-1268-A1-R1_Chr6-2g08419 [Microbotryum saponariae]|uniref:BZ3500_MvSof-1268-A1-R1_Chr6-2g08419 protein n=1 Tax=Microbotryum saponariae TaxID=289078 RepID=A0A2X0NNB2_9BASI|nr:BZ3500_MvSof-1268-A1-R1_Chr6-2g08419 [Microbotryum saponariae]SDA07696.1 BZ3501_MvSof-1269-A2-R1_Chr6-1g08133 [Microbotryum saponariae]